MYNRRKRFLKDFESDGASRPSTPPQEHGKQTAQNSPSGSSHYNGEDNVICGISPKRVKSTIDRLEKDSIIGDLLVKYYLIDNPHLLDKEDLIKLHEEAIEKATQLQEPLLVEKYQASLNTLRPIKQVSNSSITNTTASTASHSQAIMNDEDDISAAQPSTPQQKENHSPAAPVESTARLVISSPKASRFIGNKKIDDPALIAVYDELFEKHSLKN